MKLREIILAGSMFLSGLAFSQDKLQFDIYNKGEGFFGIRLNNSTFKVNSNEMDFSFLFNIYSMNLKKINNSQYREIVRNNFLWDSKEEFFEYSFKDSSYVLEDYFALGGEPRKEKEDLIGRVFDKKYKTPPEVFNDFQNGKMKDSIHFIIFGMPYSIKIEKIEQDGKTVYFYNPKELVKREPGDFIIFPYQTKVVTNRKNGKIIPLEFSTKSLNVRNGRENLIEGILNEDKE